MWRQGRRPKNHAEDMALAWKRKDAPCMCRPADIVSVLVVLSIDAMYPSSSPNYDVYRVVEDAWPGAQEQPMHPFVKGNHNNPKGRRS